MVQTRRQFVRRVAAAGAVASFGLPEAVRAQARPVRVSLAEFSADRRKVASLRRGVAVMKARPGSDHRSWFFQAAVHAYNDALLQDAIARDPKVADVDSARYWNKCPHFGQSSANFLIWHRAYIYYFERVLRDAAGDPSLALPYWDYSKPDNREFPEIFAAQYLDARRTVPNPLYHPNRELAFVTGRYDISPKVGLAETSMAAENFFHEIGTPGFGGDVQGEGHTQLGLLEQRPHNDIHIAVGGAIGSNNGAMADVPTAAFDPIFWVHHANIDRLWATWSSAPGKRWGDLPAEGWFDETPWLFVDVDGQEKSRSRRFFVDRANLSVTFDTDPSLGPPLSLPLQAVAANTAPAGGGAPEVAMESMAMAIRRKPAERELFADNVPLDVSPLRAGARRLAGKLASEEETVGAASIAPQGALGSGSPPKALEAPAPENGRVLLELSDIQFARVPSSGFGVYLDTASGASNFVGLLDLFGATHRHMGMKAVQSFDVTRILRGFASPFTLRVAPYDLFVSKTGKSVAPRSDAVRIGAVRFVMVS
jgi:hypothetical protein